MSEDGIRKGSIWMIGSQLAMFGLQGIYFVLMGRTLGSLEYGAFIGVVSLVTALGQFSTLGTEMLLLRNLSRDHQTFARTWGMALQITSVGFCILLAVALLFAHWILRPELRMLVPWIAVSDAFFGKIVQLVARAFQGAGQMSWTARLNASVNILRACLAAGLFFAVRRFGIHPSAYVWAHVYWLAPFCAAILAVVLITWQFGLPQWSRIRLHDLMDGFSFSLSGSSVSIYNDVDKTFLVSYGQIYAAGIYAAAYRVIDVATAPLYGLYAAATPRFFREGANSVSRAAMLARRLLLYTVPYGILCGAGLYLTAGLLPYLFGTSFSGSVIALRWLCLLPLLRVLHYSWGTAITASTSQWNRTATQMGSALLNLLLNFLLIPRWSWQGAAIASLLTDGVLALSSWYVLQRILNRERQNMPSPVSVTV
jgi:O-antigen/teichoic acid export membrane protein